MPHKSLKKTNYNITVFETGTVEGKPCYGACITNAPQGENVILASKTHGEAIHHLLDKVV